jgi:hypothetical protein
MAKAKMLPLPPVPVPKGDVQLTLTYEEAQFLVDVNDRIGGSPILSRRGLSGNIRRALHEIGVLGQGTYDISETDRAIYFKDFNDAKDVKSA